MSKQRQDLNKQYEQMKARSLVAHHSTHLSFLKDTNLGVNMKSQERQRCQNFSITHSNLPFKYASRLSAQFSFDKNHGSSCIV